MHLALYKECCEKAGVAPNPRCGPVSALVPRYAYITFYAYLSNSYFSCSESQSSLEGFIQAHWSKAGLKDHIVEFIVCKDGVIHIPEYIFSSYSNHCKLLTVTPFK